MEQQSDVKYLTFHNEDSSIHEFAADALLNKSRAKFVLTQHIYTYKIYGESLYYKKASYKEWVLIGNWCFYGAYIIIRYRKPVWLRPLYGALFSKMNFIHVSFGNYNIEVLDTSGHFRRSRIFKLTPPGGFEEALAEISSFSEQAIKLLKYKEVFGSTNGNHEYWP